MPEKIPVYLRYISPKDGDKKYLLPRTKSEIVEESIEKQFISSDLKNKANEIYETGLRVSGSLTDFNKTIPIVAGKAIKVNADGTAFEVFDPAEGGGGTATVDPEKVMSLDSTNTYWDGKNHPIKNISQPTSANDVATKAYVDAKTQTVNVSDGKHIYCDTYQDINETLNAVPGQVIYTSGYYNLNDGGGALYNIRAKEASDVHTITLAGSTVDVVGDNGSVIAIGNWLDPDNVTLVAELIMDNVVNVRQFGACGVDSDSDADGIQSAVNYALANDYPVYIPKGTYSLSHPINIDSYLTIYGDGQETIIDNTGSAIETTAPVFQKTTGGLTRLYFRNFVVNKGSAFLSVTTGEINISFFENMVLTQFAEAIVKAMGGYEVNTMSNCLLYSSEYGIYVPGGVYNLNNFNNCWFSGTKTSYVVVGYSGEANNYNGCGFQGQDASADYDDAVAFSFHHCVNTNFKGCYFENCHEKLVEETGYSTYGNSITFDSCHFTRARKSTGYVPFVLSTLHPPIYKNCSFSLLHNSAVPIIADYQPLLPAPNNGYGGMITHNVPVVSVHTDSKYQGTTKVIVVEDVGGFTDLPILQIYFSNGGANDRTNIRRLSGTIKASIFATGSGGQTLFGQIIKKVDIGEVGRSNFAVVELLEEKHFSGTLNPRGAISLTLGSEWVSGSPTTVNLLATTSYTYDGTPYSIERITCRIEFDFTIIHTLDNSIVTVIPV